MTRCRAIGNIPNELMALYYKQRAKAGLIITEGTSPSPNGLGYARIPGIFSEEQINGWRKVTDAVHSQGGKIAIQLMHCGRIGHTWNLPEGTKLLAPSAIKAKGQIYTDTHGMQEMGTPQAMTPEDIITTKQEFVTAAENAVKAGFDDVELHSANGYLLEQFLSPISNQRTDDYGGSMENRCRFVLEIVNEVAGAIGKNATAIRLSPYGVANDMHYYPEIEKEYTYLAQQLNNAGILYIHLVDHSSMGAPQVPDSIKNTIRQNFKNTLILSGGYTLEQAESDILSCKADLVAFGKPFINHPDLIKRFQTNSPLSDNLDTSTFYTPGEKGYTDYPTYLW
jgi:N-ethylmaleimide reductase